MRTEFGGAEVERVEYVHGFDHVERERLVEREVRLKVLVHARAVTVELDDACIAEGLAGGVLIEIDAADMTLTTVHDDHAAIRRLAQHVVALGRSDEPDDRGDRQHGHHLCSCRSQ